MLKLSKNWYSKVWCSKVYFCWQFCGIPVGFDIYYLFDHDDCFCQSCVRRSQLRISKSVQQWKKTFFETCLVFQFWRDGFVTSVFVVYFGCSTTCRSSILDFLFQVTVMWLWICEKNNNQKPVFSGICDATDRLLRYLVIFDNHVNLSVDFDVMVKVIRLKGQKLKKSRRFEVIFGWPHRITHVPFRP